MTASRAAAWLMLGLCAQRCAAQLPGMPLPAQCVGAAEGPAPRSDLNWPANETKLAQSIRQVDQGQGAEIIFYGDSIFWEYTGENLNGAPTKADLARKAILDKDFANHSYEVAAIPGDESGNLLWRLETGGEFPTIHMPKTVVILIGTNDLSYSDCHEDQQELLNAAPGIVNRVTQIVTYIHTKSPKTQIVLLGILPRGGLYWEKDQAWIWPNRYTAAIAAVNAGYYALAEALPQYLKYVYCGKPYAYEYGMNFEYVEDGIHPNQKGLELLAQCIQKDVDTDLATPMYTN